VVRISVVTNDTSYRWLKSSAMCSKKVMLSAVVSSNLEYFCSALRFCCRKILEVQIIVCK
jgi:hypothetical protein